jgi:molecular chaperone DnaK (HSP70)
MPQNVTKKAASDSPQQPSSRFVVGIDLGTTNSAVTYADTQREPWRIDVFAIPQLVAPGQVEAHGALPSFHYQAAPGELAGDALRLPWHDTAPNYAVGRFAREHGALVPGRLVSSAKSWLCHTGVDRTAGLLPWHGAADADRLSPVEVSTRYLSHIRDAWDTAFPRAPLAEQDVILTLPASFDEVARELTVRAAAAAELPRVVLIEEPQAAFYAWIYLHADNWYRQIGSGQKILVCDIGGGTTDLTLIRVRRGDDDQLQLHRVAVGEHLILGGDNLDLALARHIEQRRVEDGQLDARQWDALVGSCRRAKETLLGPDPPQQLTVSLPAAGAKLIGGGQQIELTRDEVTEVLVEGFFPYVPLDAKPTARQSGFQEFGLPYAADPAVTRHLAAFLTAHRTAGLDDDAAPTGDDPARADLILLNGGLFTSPSLRTRILDVVKTWFPGQAGGPAWEPTLLAGDRLDLAVARGAAYYGMVRRGNGVRIAADLARSYYVGVESDPPAAVCLVPAKAAAGDAVDLTGHRFELTISQPVEFPLYVSSTRLTDRPGELVTVDREQLTPLAPIRTVLHARKKTDPNAVSVELHSRITEIGTLDLWCTQVDGPRRWRMQFDVRAATQTDREAHEGVAAREGFLDEAAWEACQSLIDGTFGPSGKGNPASLLRRLSAALGGAGREQWPTSLLRRIWEALVEHNAGRRRSQAHERRWLNLLGFALRPGYGLALDDWRVDQTWRIVHGKLAYRSAACVTQSWILWRRLGGGLSAGQQQAVANPLLAPIRGLHRRMTGGGGRGSDTSLLPRESAEVWRLLGSLELLPAGTKIELGQMILDLLAKKKMQPVRPAMTWAVGRLAARVPVYGPLNTVLAADVVADWLGRLFETAHGDSMDLLAVMQMARRTEDRYRDLPEKLRVRIIDWLARHDAAPHFVELVRDGGALDREEQGSVFGESLPIGLRIA